MTAAVAALTGLGVLLIFSGLFRPPRNRLDNYISGMAKQKRISSIKTKASSHLRVSKRNFETLGLADEIWFLGLVIESGQTLYGALLELVESSRGELAKLFRPIVSNLQLGSTFEIEFGELEKHRLPAEIIELLVQLRIAVDRGTPISQVIFEQARSSAATTRSQLIAAAGKNDTKMLLPLVFLVLPLTVMNAVFPSLQMLQNIF